MTERSAVHGVFTVERTYDAAPARVFAAFADMQAKSKWFGGGVEWAELRREMDFRVGGTEHASGRWQSGVVTHFDARYHDIVPEKRIVYSYVMHIDDRKISVSLATIVIEPVGAKTHLTVTEQGVFLDGYDDAGAREHGTGMLMDRLGASLKD